LELLIVLAIIGATAGIIALSGRLITRGQDANAAVKTMQQSIWQGATMAASRGVRTNLVLSGQELEVQVASSGQVIRRYELNADAALNVSDGTLLAFTPPGKVDPASLASLPTPLQLTTNGTTYDLQISLIGEVRVAGGG
jgi:type II secretory pathway pseudopilin PulG